MRDKKLDNPVTLFAAIESTQHDILRTLAFKQRRSLADIVREAIGEYVARQPEEYKDSAGIRVIEQKTRKLSAAD
ncbi:MAG: hypothetical protein LAO21_22955 [Acidobacteriia bacterium]|nr:hypothetical protein [Terriglobia bacterium]